MTHATQWHGLRMKSVETFVRRSDVPNHVSRRRLLQVFAATVVATQVIGVGGDGLDDATAASVTSQSSPAYDGIVGLL